jgi:predicted ATPase/DNA-binding SARP family transcriptional activator
VCGVAVAAACEVVAVVATVVWWFVPVRAMNMIVTAIATRMPSAVNSVPGLIRTRGVMGSMGRGVNMVCSVLWWAAARPGGLTGLRARLGDCDRRGLQRADGRLAARLRSVTRGGWSRPAAAGTLARLLYRSGVADQMRFGILGPLEVAEDRGRQLELGGRKQRAVLAILLLHANEVVSSDRLVEDSWSGRPPASGATSLQAHISRLRRALGGDRRIVTTGGGYLLRVAPGEIDRDRFERLVEEGSAAVVTEDWELASATLRGALGLWRGAPLSDFAYDSFAQAEISRLEEMRLAALEDRIEAELALGREAQAVGDLERLAREHLYRERLRGQLMLALYRMGRQAEALAAYRKARSVLVEELGIEPSAELRELEQGILRHDPALSTPRAQEPPSGASHLPVPATPFLGRARELAEVTRLIWRADGRLLTLTGAGGSGKTRLALRAAQACAEEYRDGAWFVGFADVTEPGLIESVICHAIGLGEQADLTPSQRLEGYLRDRKLLLMLDNLEQLTPGVGVLGELLARCPGVRMLVTSREPLHLAGEQQYEVPVLDLGDAIDLFIARANTVAPNLVIDRETVGAVCERLDRLPLALELAAARTKVLTPAEILDRLEHRLPVTATGPRDAPHRQRTLQATIDWSYNLLNVEEQRLFARLSVFAGGGTLTAAQTVCGADLDTLEALLDRSLVRRDGSRYSMLATIREYALERLDQSGEGEELRTAHAQWLVELLEAQGLPQPGWPDAKSRANVVPEQENFTAALEWASRTGRSEILARLAGPLVGVWVTQGQLHEADRWMKLALENQKTYSGRLAAQVLSAAAVLARQRGEYNQGLRLGQQALEYWREVGDARAIGMTLVELDPSSRSAIADAPRERAALEQAIQFARDNDLTEILAAALDNLADLVLSTGNLSEGRALCEESLAISTPGSGARDIAILNLAYIETVDGRRTTDSRGS